MLLELRANIYIICILLTILMVGCVSIYNPATQKKELLLIDTPNEIALGKDIDRQIQNQLKILRDPNMLSRLNYIGNIITAVSDRQDLTYQFRIVKDNELNAFAVPGGFVYVNSGLMDIVNDDELAAVIGHEIGHVACRHSVKKLQASLGYQFIINIALGLGGKQEIAQATDIIFNLASLGYSRQDELLADKLAVRYTKRAGFNPYGVITFFEKLKNEVKKRGPNLRIEILSSHPDIDERIKIAKNEIELSSY